MDLDAGDQTRIFHFNAVSALSTKASAKSEAVAGEPSLQGDSVAKWKTLGGRSGSPSGDLEVVTTNLKPGYYWKNGMVYSDQTTLTEHYRVTTESSGETWLHYLVIATDPQYFTQPWIVNYHFKKFPDGSRWNPVPCSAK